MSQSIIFASYSLLEADMMLNVLDSKVNPDIIDNVNETNKMHVIFLGLLACVGPSLPSSLIGPTKTKGGKCKVRT